MDIIKYKKVGKNKYKLFLSNNKEIILYEDIILKEDLLLKKKIDNLDKILEKNKDYEVYDLSLSYINKKMRCSKEVEEYLRKKEYSEELINKTIGNLKNNGFLNDNNFVKAFSIDKFNINNYGPNKIVSELKKLNISSDIIYDNMNLDKNEIKEKLNKLIDKKIASTKNYCGSVLKQKLEMYFSNLGYEKSMINEILSNKNLLSNNLYETEYNKLYKKYSKKYQGIELELKIKQKLYQKGFIK